MKLFLHVTIITLALLFSGCAMKKEITSSEPYLITIKNKQMALSDTGFVNRGNDYVNVQVFSAGAVLFNLEMMGNYICLEGHCLEKLEFNQHFFQEEHYADMMNDILRRAPLYDGQNVHPTNNGFEQELVFENSHLIYKVEGLNLQFKDTKKGILLRLKPLP